jgi:hypothetical protein
MTVESIAATVRQWPHAVETGTYHLLFERRADLRETADGPPIFNGGGYAFCPAGAVLTAEQYQDVCDLLEAPATEDATGAEEPAPEPSPTLTPRQRKICSVRAKAGDEHG